MTRADDPTARVRARELAEQETVVNERFADYVASTAFSISLSRNMVLTLLSLADAIQKDHERSRRPLHDGALTALERRGLIEVVWQQRLFTAEARERATWRNTSKITTAGRLMLLLLAEAGQAPQMISPLPPPPPGWTDPRRKIRFDENLAVCVLPSDREEATR